MLLTVQSLGWLSKVSIFPCSGESCVQWTSPLIYCVDAAVWGTKWRKIWQCDAGYEMWGWVYIRMLGSMKMRGRITKMRGRIWKCEEGCEIWGKIWKCEEEYENVREDMNMWVCTPIDSKVINTFYALSVSPLYVCLLIWHIYLAECLSLPGRLVLIKVPTNSLDLLE